MVAARGAGAAGLCEARLLGWPHLLFQPRPSRHGFNSPELLMQHPSWVIPSDGTTAVTLNPSFSISPRFADRSVADMPSGRGERPGLPLQTPEQQAIAFAMMALALAKLTVHEANADTEDAILYARDRLETRFRLCL
jgi:hypothetical protein